MFKFRFKVEMAHGQSQRQVDADGFIYEGAWLIFYRNTTEYWRANLSVVVAMETTKND